MYTVKEAAKQLGFTEHTIRFYTDKGLCQASYEIKIIVVYSQRNL